MKPYKGDERYGKGTVDDIAKIFHSDGDKMNKECMQTTQDKLWSATFMVTTVKNLQRDAAGNELAAVSHDPLQLCLWFVTQQMAYDRPDDLIERAASDSALKAFKNVAGGDAPVDSLHLLDSTILHEL